MTRTPTQPFALLLAGIVTLGVWTATLSAPLTAAATSAPLAASA